MACIIGITGSICSGKSTVSRFFAEKGCPVWDADKIAQTAYARDGVCFSAIVHTFGTAVLQDDGAVNRACLADIVFNNETALKALEAIVHPYVRQVLLKKKEICMDVPLAVMDVPLLFEADFVCLVDYVVVVSCDSETQIQRGMVRHGWTADTVRKRMAFQMPLSEKIKKSDFVVDTNHSKRETRRQCASLWEKLMEMQREQA